MKNDNNIYINIKDIAEAKGLTSTRSIRLELNKPESKYISREVKVNGGTSYEILFSSLEPELQDKLRKNENKSTSLVPLNYQPPQFVSDNAKITANFRLNIVLALIKFRKNYQTKKQADSDFLDAYNSGLLLPKASNAVKKSLADVTFSLPIARAILINDSSPAPFSIKKLK